MTQLTVTTTPTPRPIDFNRMVDRIYRKIPFSLACELHERLISGDFSEETRRLLREAIVIAKNFTKKSALKLN